MISIAYTNYERAAAKLRKLMAAGKTAVLLQSNKGSRPIYYIQISKHKAT